MHISVADQRHGDTERIKTWSAQYGNKVKVRSSTLNEDWLSGQSGVHGSRTVETPDKILSHAREISRRRFPVVVQQFSEGIGIVVDIVWSPILNRHVIRLSTGRSSKQPDGTTWFTSATWDHEGRHEVYDPETGLPLLDPCHGQLFEGSCIQLPLGELAQELWGAVNACGIRFGIQLEIIIHPELPNTWWLVQVRPSPDRVRLHGLNVKSLNEPLLTTPAVSCAFAHVGLGVLIDTRRRTELLIAGTDAPSTSNPLLSQLFHTSSIAVWEQDPHEDFGLCQLDTAHKHGALVQVTKRVITVSTSHGRINYRLEAEQESLVTRAGIIAVTNEVHDLLVAELRQRTRNIGAISDGIVGQVAFI